MSGYATTLCLVGLTYLFGVAAGIWSERRLARHDRRFSRSARSDGFSPNTYDAGQHGAATRFQVSKINRQAMGDTLVMLTREDETRSLSENGLWIWMDERAGEDLTLRTRFVLRRVEDREGL